MDILKSLRGQRRQGEGYSTDDSRSFIILIFCNFIKGLRSAWSQASQKEDPSSLKITNSLDSLIETFQSTLIQRNQRETFESSFTEEKPSRDHPRTLKSRRPDVGFVPIKKAKKLNAARKRLSHHVRFVDHKFTASYGSLAGNLSKKAILSILGKPRSYYKRVVWLRPDDIYGKGNYELFQGKIEPNDIKQGGLGNCYFLCTLAALAERPDRIKKIFANTEVNNEGRYIVKICLRGIWCEVTVDDFFPCDPKTRLPIFSSSNGNELWVLLLEKAYAKIYGSYARTVGGFPHECLHDLTGAPTDFYLTTDPSMKEEIWKAIYEGEEKGYVMTCGTFSEKVMNEMKVEEKKSISPDHAYSLLAVYMIEVKGKWVRLVKLRNPWGEKEWMGRWSDKAPEWTPELRKEVNTEFAEDGIFFMEYEDMLKFFSDVQICRVHDDFAYSSLESRCDYKQTIFFKLTVTKPGDYYITVNQESERNHAESENYKYSEVSLVLQKMVGKVYKNVNQSHGAAQKELWICSNLNEDEYLISVKVNWNEKRKRAFSISCYGQGEAEIEETTLELIQKKLNEISRKNTHQQPVQSKPQRANVYQERTEHARNRRAVQMRNDVETFYEDRDLDSYSNGVDSSYSLDDKQNSFIDYSYDQSSSSHYDSDPDEKYGSYQYQQQKKRNNVKEGQETKYYNW